MEPTLGIGARVMASPGPPRIGAIVVLHPPTGFERPVCGPTPHIVKPGGAACAESSPKRATIKLVKRIVASPGDAIYIRKGHVYRKAAGSRGFVRERDPYTAPCGSSPECNFPTPITIPTGRWYMLGDNRGESDDSRFWGAIPTSWIIGIVTGCCTPPAPKVTLGRACKLPKRRS